jgi:glutathione peroxidase
MAAMTPARTLVLPMLAASLALLASPGEAAQAKEPPMSFFDLSARTLDGTSLPFSTYRGKVVLVVNTASECGFTPQYAGLQRLHEDYAERGLVVLGVPSNDFGGQEPGTPDQIATFTKTTYHVTFPLLEKTSTRGDGQSAVYAFLTRGLGEPGWNFHKYLVGRDGTVRAEFPSRVAPDSPELRSAIDAALAE